MCELVSECQLTYLTVSSPLKMHLAVRSLLCRGRNVTGYLRGLRQKKLFNLQLEMDPPCM